MRDLRAIKSMSGVGPRQASCHTAQVGGYVVEGHVPAHDIKGLAVPGMPTGPPGMEGTRKDDYDVLTIDNDGSTDFFAHR